MNREEEITQAALHYANNLEDVKPTDFFSRNLCIALGQAFLAGARWADDTNSNWKPSEEQLKVMAEAVTYFGDSWVSKRQETLESLYNDLKKL